jgi:predicted Fe-Mo cluster-binding NifX family protein
MRICVPTATDDGMESAVYPHFGSAPFFSIVDTDTDAVEVVRNGHQHHEHGQCNPVGSLMGVQLDAVVVRGMGRNALARLSQAGIPVYVADGDTLRDVADEARAELLLPLDVDATCEGRGGQGHGGPHHHHHLQG